MAAPVLSSSSPSNGDTDVFINNPIDATFAAALLEASVTSTTVTLKDVGANTLISVDITLPSSTVVRVAPVGSLAEDTLYELKFPGTDISLSSDYVIKDNSSSDPLVSTITVQFRTGSRTFIDDTKVDKNAVDLSLEGDLNLPIHVKALGEFALESVVPKNNSYDVADMTSVTFTFNQRLSTGDLAQDWLEVDVFPLLDSTDYLSNGSVLGTGSIPDSSISLSETTLTVNFSGTVPYNAGVQIRIDDGVLAEDGSEYGPNSYLYSATTDRYPKYSGIHEIRRELKAVSEELTNDYITATLFSAAIHYNCKYTSAASNDWLIQRWVLNRSIILILDDKELEKAIVAGTRRQLGDMSISVDPIVGLMALKHKRAEKELEKVEKTLSKNIAKSYSLAYQSGIQRTFRRWVGVNHRLVQSRFVYWQPNIPGANLNLNRAAKVPPSIYFP